MALKRRRFQPSAELERLLLELAGVEAPEGAHNGSNSNASRSGSGSVNFSASVLSSSSSSSSSSNNNSNNNSSSSSKASGSPAAAAGGGKSENELLSEASMLKRQADKADGATRYLLYLRAGLRYLELCHMREQGNVENLAMLQQTAKLLDYASHHSEKHCRLALRTSDSVTLAEYAHIAFASLRLSAVVLLERFRLKNAKLKAMYDNVNRVADRRAKAARLRGGNVLTISQGDLDADERHRQFIVQEAEDSVASLHRWHAADALAADIRDFDPAVAQSRIDVIPEVRLIGVGLDEVAAQVRHAISLIHR